ncbi:MAG: hypothetical protein K2M34_01645 [Alphaproteobacteria bacterium]|nr:hypothetical protein [Alphaproteobacteria bacterium]
MSSEKESLLPAPMNNNDNLPAVMLTYVDYDIDGNTFRAYYDNEQNMVFVVDSTQNERKPNVLLVLPASGERKWDEILVSDWGVDLETVRPRKDNKYQKLDVEYGNVDVYKRLVHDYQAGVGLNGAVIDLNVFRDNAVRRNALARLDAAQDVAAHARETIDKTNETITELNVRIKELRTKLSVQKKSIGKEPTKQSAAKILRSDSQIEATGEKIERARRRLANARRRLVIAEDDITAAQNILDLLGADTESDIASHSVMVAPKMEMMVSQSSDVPQFKEIITEPKAEKMAEEEVKPLFDKDPEILDEEIAFKPIDFGVSAVTTPAKEAEVDVVADVTPAPSPLSFAPPRASEYVEPAPASYGDFAPIPDVPAVSDSPVLDSMRPVEPVAPQPVYDVRPAPAADELAFARAAADAPIVQQPSPAYDNLSSVNNASASNVPGYNNSANAPIPGVADASASSGFRPVSPIRGATVAPVATSQGKSKLMYYIMLVILIALSIFTLWIYQRSTSQNIPELTTTTTVAKTDSNVSETQTASPFIDTAADNKVEPVVQPEPIAVDPEPVEISPEPIIPDVIDVEPVTVEPEPEPVTVEPEPVTVEPEPVQPDVTDDTSVNTVQAQSPFLTAPVEQADVESIDIKSIVNKPIYNVSQQDKMFVAAPDYETDAPVKPAQDMGYDDYNDAPDMAVCSDGALPDANGCCGGEVFTDMEDGTFACCQPIQGGECFAPLR